MDNIKQVLLMSNTVFIVFQTLNPKWNEEILFRVSMHFISL